VSISELVLRAIGITLLALLAVILLRTKRRDLTAQFGGALCVCVGAFLLTSTPDADQRLGVIVYPLTALCSTHTVWFWLFCSALFADRPALRPQHAIFLVSMAAAGTLYQWLLPMRSAGETEAFAHALGLAFGTASLVFACLAPVTVYLGKMADLDARRLLIRKWFVPTVSAYLLLVAVTQVVSLFAGRPTPKLLVLSNLVVIDLLATAALLTFVRVRVINWLDLIEPAPDPEALSFVQKAVLERLTRRLVPERLYAREGLTIIKLAAMLGTQEHVLRRVINQGLRFRNFNEFLHSHRLREAASRLRDAAGRRLPILTIALDVGYGSIGPFNRAFKERFGVTPSEYRRAGTGEAGFGFDASMASQAPSAPRG